MDCVNICLFFQINLVNIYQNPNFFIEKELFNEKSWSCNSKCGIIICNLDLVIEIKIQ